VASGITEKRSRESAVVELLGEDAVDEAEPEDDAQVVRCKLRPVLEHVEEPQEKPAGSVVLDANLSTIGKKSDPLRDSLPDRSANRRKGDSMMS